MQTKKAAMQIELSTTTLANIFLVEGKNDVNGFFVAFILRCCKTAASHPRSHAQKKGFDADGAIMNLKH